MACPADTCLVCRSRAASTHDDADAEHQAGQGMQRSPPTACGKSVSTHQHLRRGMDAMDTNPKGNMAMTSHRTMMTMSRRQVLARTGVLVTGAAAGWLGVPTRLRAAPRFTCAPLPYAEHALAPSL